MFLVAFSSAAKNNLRRSLFLLIGFCLLASSEQTEIPLTMSDRNTRELCSTLKSAKIPFLYLDPSPTSLRAVVGHS